MMRTLRAASVVALMVGGVGCMDLDVTNPNEPDRDRALATGTDVEALISGSFKTWWDLQQGRGPGPALASAADELSPPQANYGFYDTGVEPRVPVVNLADYTWNYYLTDPWFLLNRAMAAVRDALLSIEAGVLIGPGGSDIPRAHAFAKFMQGLGHAQIAILYDQGVIIDESVEDIQTVAFQPYADVMAAARGYFAEARELAASDPFSIPGDWLGPASYTSEDLIRLSHSYEARLMAQVARSPEERAQVNWNEVLSHIEQGVTQDFGIDIGGAGGPWSYTLKGTFSDRNENLDQAFVGRADQSGRWQTYENTPGPQKLPFVVDTDDRRIGNPADTLGIYIQYRQDLTGDPGRGTMFLSHYAPLYWRELADLDEGFAPDLTVEEMDYLRAEAYIRTGQTDAGLAIINENRVEQGGLPPATAQGVQGQTRCVPRTVTGACGDLLYTLAYETRMKPLALLSQGSTYYFSRGFAGWLREGTPVHLPVPARELMTLQMEVYTFGGVGGIGSAPAWR
jgi:hypothetical protein